MEGQLASAEELIELEEESLWGTARFVLAMVRRYLEQLGPTNITYYHFNREKDFYTKYTAFRYILVVGLQHVETGHHVLRKLRTQQRVQMWGSLQAWLLSFVHYRCSAIYLPSSCADPLIWQTHYLAAALQGHGQESIFAALPPDELKRAFNSAFYVNAYLLARSVDAGDYLGISVVLTTLRRLLQATVKQTITTFLPSYLHAHLIGFNPAPFTHHIVYQLLLYFVGQGAAHPSEDFIESQEQLAAVSSTKQQLDAECWSIIELLAEDYEFDKEQGRQAILRTIPHTPSTSLVRSFLIRIAESLNLDLEDEAIREYRRRQKKPYLVGDRVVRIEVVCRNYHIVMEGLALRILHEAAKGRVMAVEREYLWEQMLQHNPYDIPSTDEYLRDR